RRRLLRKAGLRPGENAGGLMGQDQFHGAGPLFTDLTEDEADDFDRLTRIQALGIRRLGPFSREPGPRGTGSSTFPPARWPAGEEHMSPPPSRNRALLDRRNGVLIHRSSRSD